MRFHCPTFLPLHFFSNPQLPPKNRSSGRNAGKVVRSTAKATPGAGWFLAETGPRATRTAQHRRAARTARCIAQHPRCTAPLAPSQPPPKGASNDAPHDPLPIPDSGCGNIGSLNPELGSQKSNNRNQRGAPTPLTSPRPPPMSTAPPPGHEGGQGGGHGPRFGLPPSRGFPLF